MQLPCLMINPLPEGQIRIFFVAPHKTPLSWLISEAFLFIYVNDFQSNPHYFHRNHRADIRRSKTLSGKD